MRKHNPHQAPDGQRIRRLAALESVELLLSCPEKLRKHEITRPDALAALMTCSVVKSERCADAWRRTVRGFDRDEGEIFLVVTIETDIRRIVVFDGWR
jgi:hypothetical protein